MSTTNTALANIENLSDFQLYSTPEWWIEVKVFEEDRNLRLSQKWMGELFDVSTATINEHLKNIFKSQELDDNSVVRKFLITAGDGKNYKTNHYNLDAIISVWYRVNSKQATHFRKRATSTLKDHVMKWYTINPKRLEQTGLWDLKKSLEVMRRAIESKALSTDETAGMLDLIMTYLPGFLTLHKFDQKSLEGLGYSNQEQYKIDRLEAIVALASLKAKLIAQGEATELFAHPKNDGGLDACFGAIYQTSEGIDLYQSVEEKAAMLLYLVIKNHPFTDWNKRSGAFLFIWYLDKNNLLQDSEGKEKISQQTMVALALLIATSDSSEKDMMVGLVVALLK